MKNFILCVLALGALGVGLGIAQSDDVDREIQEVRQELADLGLRVSRLEHASGGVPTGTAAGPIAAASSSAAGSSAASSSSAAAPARTMVLVSVSLSDHTHDNSAEIAQLKRQHACLVNTVNQAANQSDEDLGQQAYVGGAAAGGVGWRGAAGGGVVTTNIGSVGREVLGDDETRNRYSTQAAITEEKLQRLQAADSDPKQILLGHGDDGRTVYTLESKFDLSKSLDNIAIGDTITWTGTRVSAQAGGETWEIDSVQKVR
jgi:hypothetical protein